MSNVKKKSKLYRQLCRLAFDTLCTSENFTNCPVIFFLFKMIGILNRIRKSKIFLKYINLLWEIRCNQIKCMLVKNNSINFPDKFFALFWLVLEITKKMNIYKGTSTYGEAFAASTQCRSPNQSSRRSMVKWRESGSCHPPPLNNYLAFCVVYTAARIKGFDIIGILSECICNNDHD